MSQSSEFSAAGCLFCCEETADVVSSCYDISISGHTPSSSSSSSLPHYSPPSYETAIVELIDVERHHMPRSDYLQRLRDRSIDTTARRKSVNWILKVHEHYQFRPVTAFLSVNYLDRFLSCCFLPIPSGWPFQLLSVACLSLAAKMEEPRVPHLLDLQIFEPGFVFEPRTVQGMELRVMAYLNWRLRSVTPFDYLHSFASKLPSSSDPKPEYMTQILSDATRLLLTTIPVIDFLRFPPSTVAAAAVLCLAGAGRGIQHQSRPYFHERINQEMVRSCHQLMDEYVADTCRRREAAPPPSPIGVLDAATTGSYDARSESQPDEPSRKRLRSSAPDVHRL